MLTVRLPRDMEKKLSALAKSTNRTKSFYVKQALRENFEDMEDTILADKNWKKVLDGETLYTPEEVVAELGLR